MSIASATKINCGQPGTCESKTECCPNCGAVECLCRPRFFAGQLLSEQDLNRLDQYIKNKNRLHNRNQHGWGVVNGLKVLCDPCGEIKVTEGYAVDPCGDDIVVCEATRVNICDLIRQCKEGPETPNCEPFHTPPNANCDDIEEEWVLTISYREWASRGVTALRGTACKTGSCCSPSSGSSCACGGGGGGCSSSNLNSKSSPKQSTTSSLNKNRGAPPECEPTVVCEGFYFGAYPKPVDVDDPQDDDDEGFNLSIDNDGSFAQSFNCCAEALVATIPPMPDLTNDNIIELAREISAWCCRFRQNLLTYFTTHPNTSCEVIEFLQQINCPSIASPNTFVIDWFVSFFSLLAAWAEGLKVCICLSLLPPTPQTTCDSRVPLATVRVRARDCKILSICNWTTQRKMMMTWPALGHWLGIFSVGDFFHNLLDSFCCNSLLGIFDNIIDRFQDVDRTPGTVNPNDDFTNATGDVNATINTNTNANIDSTNSDFSSAIYTNNNNYSNAMNMTRENLSFAGAMNFASADLSSQLSFSYISRNTEKFSRLIEGMVSRGDEPLQLGALLNNVSPRFRVPDNGQQLNAVEARNLPLVMISEIVARPIMNNVLGTRQTDLQMRELHRNLRRATGSDNRVNTGVAPAGARTSDDELRAQVDDLQARVDEQNQLLANLRTQLNRTQ